MLECQPALLNPSSLQGHLPSDSSKQIPEQEVQGCDPAICLIPSLFLTFISLTSPSFFVSVKFSRTPPLISSDHLCQKGIINSLQKAPGLLVPCCVALLADTRMIKVFQRTRACIHEASSSRLKKASTVICWDCDILPKRLC